VDGRPLDTDSVSRSSASRPGSVGQDAMSSDSDSEMKIDIFGAEQAQAEAVEGPKWSEAEEDERRTMLRSLETKLLLMRDDLEAQDVDAAAIEDKVQKRRTEAVKAWEKVGPFKTRCLFVERSVEMESISSRLYIMAPHNRRVAVSMKACF
jgi:hypothetical protein